MFNYTEASDLYFSLGITCIPCDGKKPLKKEGYQKDLTGPTSPLLPDFGTPNGLAALCGSYSSGLLILDFDLKNCDGVDVFSEWFNLLKEDMPRLASLLPAFKTVSGGYKVLLFGDNMPSAVLAKNEKGKPIIELQGEKALSMLPPSLGYDWTIGGPESIPFLTQSDVDYMVSLARCFNEYVEPEMPAYTPKGFTITGDSPLNKFDSDTDMTEWMVSLGWKVIKANSSQIHLNRPGAKHKRGVDATVFRSNNSVAFWSTSQELVPETNRTYRPSQFLVFTKYNGDFSNAAKDLASQYSLTPYNPNPKAAALTSKPVRPVKNAEHRFIPDNPAVNLEKQIFMRKLETHAKESLFKGVSVTEDFLNHTFELFAEIDKNEIEQFIADFYEENKDDFGADNQRFSPFQKAEKFLNKNFVIRRNSVLLSTHILNKSDLSETTYNIDSIWNMLQGNGVKVNRSQIVSLCNDSRIYQTYDPFVEYFNTLPQNPETGWIAKLADYVVVDEAIQPFWQSMFRKAMIRSIAGAIGEYPNREAIVLCSAKERVGKTQFVRFLSPWGTKKYFSDEPIIQNKDQTFRIAQNLIYLIDEIGQKSVNEKMADFLKMLISKQTINERRVYDTDNTTLNRKVTFWATSNIPYLYPGENSRWITIPVVSINHNYSNYKSGVQEVLIDKVWAEAYKAYMDGEDFELDDAEREIQAKINADWYIGNEAIGLVDSYINSSDMDCIWKTPEMIINDLVGYNPTIARRITSRNLIEAMRSRGIKHRYLKNENDFRVHEFFVNIRPKDFTPEPIPDAPF